MKLVKLLFFILVISFNLFPQKNVNELKSRIDEVISDDFFKSSQIGIDVYDLTDQKPLFQKDQMLLFNPASNMKILTSIAGLYFLGPNYNFTTALYYTGEIKKKILNGNLYVLGGFDPLFSTADLDTLMIGLKQTGIKLINGNIYADVSAKDSLFWGNGWMWDDDPSTDAPYLSALTINEDMVKIAYHPTMIDSPVSINPIPVSNYYTIQNTAVTIPGDSSNLKVNRDWINRKNNITVSGFVPYYSEPDTAEINIYNPSLYFLNLFREKLDSNNIKFNGHLDTLTLFSTGNLIGLYKRPLSKVLTPMLKNSDNLIAENILYAISNRFFGKHATAKNGLKMIDSLMTIAGFDPDDYRIVDGSGVSHYNLISPELILGILKYIYYEQPEIFSEFYKDLPVAGEDGTLEKRMVDTDAENNIHAKTGTLSGVSCLSGYVNTKSNHFLAFSIMIQNFATHAKVAKSFEDKICNILADYK